MHGQNEMTELNLPNVSLVVNQDKINLYAEIANDFNPIHIDPAFAATTPMGEVIAHGTMSLNLIWQSVIKAFPTMDWNEVSLDVKFLRPVKLKDVVTAGGRSQADNLFDVWVKNQRNEPVITGTAMIGDRATQQFQQPGHLKQ